MLMPHADRADCTVAQYLAVRLGELGIQHLFNVAGSYCGGLLKVLGREGLPKAIFTTYELESGYAADAYARVRGFGAVCSTYGVGAYSLLNAIAGSYAERSAVILINGGPSDKQLARELEYGVLFL